VGINKKRTEVVEGDKDNTGTASAASKHNCGKSNETEYRAKVTFVSHDLVTNYAQG